MKYSDCVELLVNVNETKRIASAYVEDCRRLCLDELKQCLVKTKEQFVSEANVATKLKQISLNSNPVIRIVSPIFIREYLLNINEYISLHKASEEAIIHYEQAIIDLSNNFDYKSISKDFALFKFILDVAWNNSADISVDEKNLIEAIRVYLNITFEEQNMLEAKSGRFPTIGNVVHTRADIDLVRKELQSAGLLFCIKNSDGVACDVIPEEIVDSIRKYYNIEIKTYGYTKLIEHITKITKKQYLIDIIQKYNANKDTATVDLPPNPSIIQCQEIILKTINPSNLIGGFTPRDGLDLTALTKWCSSIDVSAYGSKAELISRIIKHYDGLQEIAVTTDDERETYYAVYHELAYRQLSSLRQNGIISKDLHCERYFEKATDYLFENKLFNKPLALTGTEHPDGKLSYRDKYVLWDNKSKETPVNLKDHISQFDGYIKNSDKPVAVFIVVGPEFTDNSVSECVKYSLNNETLILLITADELKEVAEEWSKDHEGESFNLGYFKQNGRFDRRMITF